MHSFDPAIACEVGIGPATIFNNIAWWIRTNAAEGRHCHDGHTWTYNSIRGLAQLFPYMSEDQVRRALDKLVDAGLIVTGNYNQSAYDRTRWFRLGRHMHLADLPNGFGENAEPIPDINPDIKPVVTPPISPPAGELALTAPSPKPDSDAAFEAFWKAYPNKKSKGAARTAFARAIKRAPAAHLMAGLERAKAMDRRFRDLKFTPHASTWLNAEGFNDEHASHHHQNDPRHSQREHPKPSGGLFGAVMEAVRFYDDQERMGQAGETADERAVPLLPPAGSVG